MRILQYIYYLDDYIESSDTVIGPKITIKRNQTFCALMYIKLHKTGKVAISLKYGKKNKKESYKKTYHISREV